MRRLIALSLICSVLALLSCLVLVPVDGTVFDALMVTMNQMLVDAAAIAWNAFFFCYSHNHTMSDASFRCIVVGVVLCITAIWGFSIALARDMSILFGIQVIDGDCCSCPHPSYLQLATALVFFLAYTLHVAYYARVPRVLPQLVLDTALSPRSTSRIMHAESLSSNSTSAHIVPGASPLTVVVHQGQPLQSNVGSK